MNFNDKSLLAGYFLGLVVAKFVDLFFNLSLFRILEFIFFSAICYIAYLLFTGRRSKSIKSKEVKNDIN